MSQPSSLDNHHLALLAPAIQDGVAYIIASGPSAADVSLEKLPGAQCIAVNDAYRLKPDAAIAYAADWEWWVIHGDNVKTYPIMARVIAQLGIAPMPAVQRVIAQHSLLPAILTSGSGLAAQRLQIHAGQGAGKNSTVQAMGLAALLGARAIVLIGVDLGSVGGRSHFFGDHPPDLQKKHSDYFAFKTQIEQLVAALKLRNTRVINCSPHSHIAGCIAQPLSGMEIRA